MGIIVNTAKDMQTGVGSYSNILFKSPPTVNGNSALKANNYNCTNLEMNVNNGFNKGIELCPILKESQQVVQGIE